MFNKVGKIEDVNEAIQKIIDANVEKYFIVVDINTNGSASVFIGDEKSNIREEKKCQ